MKMKRLILLMMLPLALAAGCSHRGEADAESALYKRFSALPETAVAQVCGFALCDTVSVDVVLLQAESDAAWEHLKEMLAVDDTTGVTSWLGDTEEPATRAKWDGQPKLRVVASHAKRAVGLYRLDDERQYDALLDYQMWKMERKEF